MVQDEIGAWPARGVVAPVGEQVLAEAGLGRPLEEPRGDDLVRVDVVDGQDHRARSDLTHRFHQSSSLASAIRPATAAAAAVRGLARKVRLPGPWRPSK